MAGRFDARAGRFKETHANMIERTKKYLKPGDIVLDFGCATGTVAIELAGYVKEIHGIDVSSKMIEAARRKASECTNHTLSFSHATLFDGSLNIGSFDVILAFNVLHFLEDKEMGMQRIHQLLKPGGLCISATGCLGEKGGLLRIYIILAMRLGRVPPMRFFTIPELEESFTGGNLHILETAYLNRDTGKTPNYFIVAQKSEEEHPSG